MTIFVYNANIQKSIDKKPKICDYANLIYPNYNPCNCIDRDITGHGDFLTTFNVYSHADDSAKKTEMDYITGCFTELFDDNGTE